MYKEWYEQSEDEMNPALFDLKQEISRYSPFMQGVIDELFHKEKVDTENLYFLLEELSVFFRDYGKCEIPSILLNLKGRV